MPGWETFALVLTPAAVAAVAGYIGGRQTLRADLEKMRAEKVFDRLQTAYSELVAADRVHQFFPDKFTDPEYVDEWNETKFRPAAAPTYLLGSDDVRFHLDELMESYRRGARGEVDESDFQEEERLKMIDAMRADLRGVLQPRVSGRSERLPRLAGRPRSEAQ